MNFPKKLKIKKGFLKEVIQKVFLIIAICELKIKNPLIISYTNV